MKIVGLMKVRNEEWVLGASLPAALRVADEVIVLDHGSDDATPEIIRDTRRRFPGRVHHLIHDDPVWTEASMRQRMVDAARELGGTHFYVIDADEVLTGNLLGSGPRSLRRMLGELHPGQALWLPWLAMWRSLDRYRDDTSVWSNNFMLFAFRDATGVTYAPREGGYDIHARRPFGLAKADSRPLRHMREGGVFHLQFANWRRLRAKHAWYKMIEQVRFPGRSTVAQLEHKYNRALDERGLITAQAPGSWWAPYDGLPRCIDLTGAPWHEEACRQMWAEHGPGPFDGLELWGVPRGEETPAPVVRAA